MTTPKWVSAAAIKVPTDPDDPPSRQILAHPHGPQFGITIDDLDDCTATAAGLVTPAAALLARNAEDLTTARAAITARRATAAHTWDRSDLRRKVLAATATFPQVFAYTSPADLGIHAAPAHWRALLYGDLILAGRPGTTHIVAGAIAMFERREVTIAHRRLAEAAVTGYLGLLTASR